MEAVLASPAFWAFLGVLATPVLLGIGWLVRRALGRKDEGLRKYDQEIQKAREEAERKDLRYMERTEEAMQLRAEKHYEGKLREYQERELQECLDEIARCKDRLQGSKSGPE